MNITLVLLRFGVISAVNGSLSPIYYAVLTVLPLPIMWAITVATYVKTAQRMRVSRSISSSVASRGDRTEMMLARTLGLMVGFYTLSLLPSAAMIAVGSLTPGTDMHEPYSFDPVVFSRVYTGKFFAYVCFTLNTVWNFFIYNARNPQFKKASQKLRKRLLVALGCSRFYGLAGDQMTMTTHSTSLAIKSMSLTASTAASATGNVGSTSDGCLADKKRVDEMKM